MKTSLNWTLLGLLVLLSQTAPAGEDPHDKLVYSRYSRAFGRVRTNWP